MYLCHILFIHPSVKGHNGYLQDLVVMICAAINVGLHVSLSYNFFNYFGKILRRSITLLNGILFLIS